MVIEALLEVVFGWAIEPRHLAFEVELEGVTEAPAAWTWQAAIELDRRLSRGSIHLKLTSCRQLLSDNWRRFRRTRTGAEWFLSRLVFVGLTLVAENDFHEFVARALR